MILEDLLKHIKDVLLSPSKHSYEQIKKARQCLFNISPLSSTIEKYMNDNEGKLQSLDKFQLMKPIYNNLPQRLLLKCSRKTLKSTLLSNIICLNMVRYNNYHMLYVAPQELSTKLFSTDYLNPRFESPAIKQFVSKLKPNDVFQKKLPATNSSIILRFCNVDATRMRGPSTCENIFDEIQNMSWDVVPIINETMAILPFKREIYAGTPLTTSNTIHNLWGTSTQNEWHFKCKHCNFWNALIEANQPIEMIQREGLCCCKCGKLIDSSEGEWIGHGSQSNKLVGYHMAQPIIPFYNTNPKHWEVIFDKVHGPRAGTIGQIYNETFGLSCDSGAVPITEDELKVLCVLGKQTKDLRDTEGIFEKNRSRYNFITTGADWGVNMATSRTSACMGALRDDGIYEVFFSKIYKEHDYDYQIRDVADRMNAVSSFGACDSGPDPNRGIQLMHRTSEARTQLVRYECGKVIQHYMTPPDTIDMTQNRWCLHRSDVMTFVFNLLKTGKILFPRWEDCEECMRDILNVQMEVREGQFVQTIFYTHKPDKPDDFFHALVWAVCQAHLLGGNPLLHGPSSYGDDHN